MVEFFTTSLVGWIAGRATMPFCRSMTISAVFGSSVVTVIYVSFGDRTVVRNGQSGGGKPLEQLNGAGQLLLLLAIEVGLDGAEQPVLAGGPSGRAHLAASSR